MLTQPWYGQYLADEVERLKRAVSDGSSLANARCLAQAREAERRFYAGTYPVCARCGGDIDWPMRQAFPQATLCSRCDPLYSHVQADEPRER